MGLEIQVLLRETFKLHYTISVDLKFYLIRGVAVARSGRKKRGPLFFKEAIYLSSYL